MKKLNLFYVMMLCCIQVSIAQVYVGDLTLRTQAEINAFNYFEIQGSLTIEESNPGDIIHLDGLSELARVSENLVIQHNQELNNINGLSNLGELRQIEIRNNPQLTTLDGLSSVRTGDLFIEANDSLQNLDGLSSINTNGIVVRGNHSLTNIDGLSNCSQKAFFIEIIGNVSLKNLDGLNNIPGLSNLLGVLRVRNNNALENGCGITKMLLDQTNGSFIEKTIHDNGPTTSSIDDILDNCITCNGTYTGDLVLSSQVEIDAFNYCEVIGNLTIEEGIAGNIINLDGLLGLERISGEFIITNNQELNNLIGLTRLREVDLIDIDNNPKLSTLIGLSNLEDLSYIKVSSNKSLLNIDGFSKINTGSIVVENNDSLVSVDGFSSCTKPAFLVQIKNNKSLNNLNGLNNIPEMDQRLGVLRVVDNPVLENACSITKLLLDPNSLGSNGEITIRDNGPTTSSVDDILDNCITCNEIYTGDLVLSSQAQIDTFNYCEITGDLTIQETTAGGIVDLRNLNKLERLGGDLNVFGNSALLYVKSFRGLTKIKTLHVRDNASLKRFVGFTKLKEVDNVILANNDKLVVLDFKNITTLQDLKMLNVGLSSLDSFNGLEAINGDFYLDNINISNLDVLQNVTNLGNLFLYRNQLLQNITGLSGASVHGSVVRISSNAALTNLNGLTGLTSLGADLIVSRNQSLQNLDGLINLSSVGNRLIIGDNKNLQNGCGIVVLLENPNTVGGQISIYNNTINTNSAEAIINNCNPAIGPITSTLESGVSMYPVPSTGRELNISGAIQNTRYQIVSFAGEVVAEGVIEGNNEQVIFAKPLEKGIYFVKLMSGNQTETQKFLVN
ncbi:T9SS type A sorting domain-containing protein [Aquimarina mytili]|uniref:T9SS type A sorting domain-containing protein n=1 Tax=Aquimarina mytili TaxID=874423 RepID=A0A936ZMT7_9FLAO|nr:T9SS type A sorting domain-containing protein [Aquimarina mytili]MBL0682157.1 T9SS type A sorting domain-containing protein [Aquimarina mytili]